MLQYPLVAPRFVVAPAVRVQVERAIVQRLNAQIPLKVHTLATSVSIAPVTAGAQPSFIPQRHEMCNIKRLDVRRDLRSPIVNDIRVAPVTAGLVGQLPGEYRRRGLVPIHNELYVVLVCCLGSDVGVEGLRRAAKDGAVGVYTAEVVPVVDEWQYELDIVFLSGGDGCIEAGDSCLCQSRAIAPV